MFRSGSINVLQSCVRLRQAGGLSEASLFVSKTEIEEDKNDRTRQVVLLA